MISINDWKYQNELKESWARVPRTLFIHKLVDFKPQLQRSIDKLIEMGIYTSDKDIYMFSFTHPDGESLTSFTGHFLPKPNIDRKVWFAPLSPLRGVLYKGHGSGGPSGGFSLEQIQKSKFSTTSFLFSGVNSTFKKVDEIDIEIVSTTIPIPIPLVLGVYEKYDIDLLKNKYNVGKILLKKLTAVTLPQALLSKANYAFVYRCQMNQKE